MKTAALALAALLTVPAAARAGDDPATWDRKQSGSYAFGVDMGRGFAKQGVEVDVELLARGIKDALEGKTPPLTERELGQALGKFQGDLRVKQEMTRRREAAQNRLTSDAWMADNAKAPGVTSLASGLQYRVLAAGKGKPAGDAELVIARWRATLPDGAEVDSSVAQPEGAPLRIGAAIPGVREALKLMPPGAKWQLFVPPHLGYQDRGRGREIPPNAVLVYELELVRVP
ncbi:MAG: FKBP-type peptidyl-prolyl cis-trans isomerase N-terminal domain-containing protein [Anaeromyxobacter sp.]